MPGGKAKPPQVGHESQKGVLKGLWLRLLGSQHLAVLDLEEMTHVTPITSSMPSSSSGSLDLSKRCFSAAR